MSAATIKCKCGHGINIHSGINGCQRVDTVNNYDSVCKCFQTPQDIAAAELAALQARIAELEAEIASLSEPSLPEPKLADWDSR